MDPAFRYVIQPFSSGSKKAEKLATRHCQGEPDDNDHDAQSNKPSKPDGNGFGTSDKNGGMLPVENKPLESFDHEPKGPGACGALARYETGPDMPLYAGVFR